MYMDIDSANPMPPLGNPEPGPGEDPWTLEIGGNICDFWGSCAESFIKILVRPDQERVNTFRTNMLMGQQGISVSQLEKNLKNISGNYLARCKEIVCI